MSNQPPNANTRRFGVPNEDGTAGASNKIKGNKKKQQTSGKKETEKPLNTTKKTGSVWRKASVPGSDSHLSVEGNAAVPNVPRQRGRYRPPRREVDAENRPRPPGHFQNLFASRLPPPLDDRGLLQLFSAFGPLRAVVMPSKGAGFVLFPDAAAGRRAHAHVMALRAAGALDPPIDVFPSRHTADAILERFAAEHGKEGIEVNEEEVVVGPSAKNDAPRRVGSVNASPRPPASIDPSDEDDPRDLIMMAPTPILSLNNTAAALDLPTAAGSPLSTSTASSASSSNGSKSRGAHIDDYENDDDDVVNDRRDGGAAPRPPLPSDSVENADAVAAVSNHPLPGMTHDHADTSHTSPGQDTGCPLLPRWLPPPAFLGAGLSPASASLQACCSTSGRSTSMPLPMAISSAATANIAANKATANTTNSNSNLHTAIPTSTMHNADIFTPCPAGTTPPLSSAPCLTYHQHDPYCFHSKVSHSTVGAYKHAPLRATCPTNVDDDEDDERPMAGCSHRRHHQPHAYSQSYHHPQTSSRCSSSSNRSGKGSRRSPPPPPPQYHHASDRHRHRHHQEDIASAFSASGSTDHTVGRATSTTVVRTRHHHCLHSQHSHQHHHQHHLQTPYTPSPMHPQPVAASSGPPSHPHNHPHHNDHYHHPTHHHRAPPLHQHQQHESYYHHDPYDGWLPAPPPVRSPQL